MDDKFIKIIDDCKKDLFDDRLYQEDLIEFILKLDLSIADSDFTISLIKTLMESLKTDLGVSDMRDEFGDLLGFDREEVERKKNAIKHMLDQI